MERQRWEKIKDLFEHALELAPESRAAYLDGACEGDTSLCSEVEALLDHDQRAGSFLQGPPAQEMGGPETFNTLTFSPGEILCGRFQITRFISHGGMGEVYEARDLELGTRVALKTLRPEIARDAWALNRFKQEVQLARRVTHPNVCRIFDMERHRIEDSTAGNGRDLLFITMELLQGEGLSERLRREGRMSVTEALPLIRQMAEALDAAHDAGVIHRDFKPGNVMLVPAKAEENGERAVVTDFGLARAAVDAAASRESFAQTLSKTHQLLGTLAYMAPEQLEGGEATAATDVYALGLVAYEMLAGRAPFPENAPLAGALLRVKGPPHSPRVHAPELDRACKATILRCLETAPHRRFPSAREAAAAFGRIGKPGPQAVVSRIKAQIATREPVRRLRSPLAVASFATVLLLPMIALYLGMGPAPKNDGFPKPFGVAAIRLNTARENHTATLLKNGMVLIAGGEGDSGANLASSELYDPSTGTFSATGRLNTARESHTATLLKNGMVLIAGGCSSNCSAFKESNMVSAELYNPATRTFTATGRLHDAREFHTATLLNNGMVLIVGGLSSGSVFASAELYNSATGTFTYTGSLTTARYQHASTLLPKGIVLIAGGRFTGTGYVTASAELYNPATGTFAVTGPLSTERASGTATLLNSGLVLLAGGEGSSPYLTTAELYNPATGAFTATGSLSTARAAHTATLLINGEVLIAGGYNGAAVGTAELY